MAHIPSLAAAELAFFLSFIGGLALHEAGHAIAGRIAGLDVRLISLGQGPALLHTRLGRMTLVLRLLPTSGYVAVAAHPGMSHRRYAAMIAAGPAVNATLLALALMSDWLLPPYHLLLVAICAGQALLVVFTLLPYRSRSMGTLRGSDGMKLWTHLFGQPADPFMQQYAMLGGTSADGTPLLPPTPDGAELLYQLVRPDRHFDSWAARDASAAVLRLVDHAALNPLERANALNFLASNQVLFRAAEASAGQLGLWSEEACQLASFPAFTVTKGGVLAITGRAVEAEPLLRPLAGDATPLLQRCLARLHLAQAAAAQGHAEDARIWLHRAAQDAAVPTPMRRILLRIVALAEKHPPLAPVDPMAHTAITPP